MSAPRYTARRVQRGESVLVEVLDEAGVVAGRAGGARARRASAAVVTQWSPASPRLRLELRSSPTAAEKVAAGNLRAGAVSSVAVLLP